MRKNFYALSIQLFFVTLSLLLLSIPIFSQTTYNITDPEALEDQTYVAGDEIILADGTVEARYLKLIGYGRFNSDGDTRKSVWSAVGEIEFYGSGIVAVDDNEFANRTLIYPVPAKDILHVENINHVSVISTYGIDGAKIMEKKRTDSASAIDLNVSSIPNGSYILVLKGEQVYRSKPFIISH